MSSYAPSGLVIGQTMKSICVKNLNNITSTTCFRIFFHSIQSLNILNEILYITYKLGSYHSNK